MVNKLMTRAALLSQQLRNGMKTSGILSGVAKAVRDLRIGAGSPVALCEMYTELMAKNPAIAHALAGDGLMAYAFYARLRRVLELAKPDLIIDAGAHEGQFAGLVQGYCEYSGEVVSFEPVKAHFERLSAHLGAYRDWKAVNAALGDTDGETMIHVGASHGGTSSLLPQTDILATYVSDAQLGEKQPVKLMRLDTYLTERFGEKIPERIFLKLDVQGYEEQVFRSAGRFLPNVRLLLAEISALQFYEGQKTFAEMCTLFRDAGFTPILIENNFGYCNLIYYDFDVFFCRDEDLRSLSLAAVG
ncbi:FkbM family methyltransferase [Rhodoplanes sp. SY1]|uniref:FkbM family methyltransferase n=1 Tax=Rhodoplanes sp. SY1 TaxID=3166646 RepID=UPI0038B59648